MSIQQHDLFAVLCRFGQAITIRPKGRSARSIVGVVDRRGDYRQVGGTMQQVRLLHVTVLKDETNTTYGGIDAPEQSDVATVDGVDYTFNGTIVDENSYGWELEFQSTQMKRMGSNVSAR